MYVYVTIRETNERVYKIPVKNLQEAWERPTEEFIDDDMVDDLGGDTKIIYVERADDEDEVTDAKACEGCGDEHCTLTYVGFGGVDMALCPACADAVYQRRDAQRRKDAGA